MSYQPEVALQFLNLPGLKKSPPKKNYPRTPGEGQGIIFRSSVYRPEVHPLREISASGRRGLRDEGKSAAKLDPDFCR